jgi:toxin ParE1/3/4
MNLPIVPRDEAQAEFDAAFDFHERQRSGSGVKFVAREQDVFDQIGANLQLHAGVFADIRKAVVARSPYCVFYRAEATRVRVIALFHTARDPSIWRGRA